LDSADCEYGFSLCHPYLTCQYFPYEYSACNDTAWRIPHMVACDVGYVSHRDDTGGIVFCRKTARLVYTLTSCLSEIYRVDQKNR